MIGHTTLGVQATNTWTRVHAFLVDTRLVARAITVHHAFRTAATVRITEIFRQTSTGAGSVALTALGIGTTGGGLAGSQTFIGYGWRLWVTAGEWVTCVTRVAGADGRVVYNTTESIKATRSRTGILAALIDARQVGRTLCVDSALWAAIWRPTHEIWQAGAHARLAHDTTLGIASTGTGYTRIFIGLGLLRFLLPRRTANERIAAVAGWAGADRVVVGHFADSLIATGTRTWVRTALVHTCSVLSAFGANRALRTTSGRCANIIGNAGADRMSVNLTALAVGSAGRRTTWFNGSGQSWYLPTKLRGISSETGRTTAAGGVVDHVALGRDATDSRTGIAALVVEAGAVLRAVTIEHALWAALRVRVSIILR